MTFEAAPMDKDWMAHPMPSGRHRQRGVTYLLLLIGVAILSAGLAAGAQAWSVIDRHRKLRQLEWVGEQYRQAIGRYYESSPGTVKRYPQSLDELLYDKRFLTTRRYLRALYTDPFAANTAWNLIPAPDGGIRGIRSAHPHSNSREFVYVQNANVRH